MDRLLRVRTAEVDTHREFTAYDRARIDVTFGDKIGMPVAIRFITRAAQRGVLIDPELRLGEAYMDGGVVLEQGSIADLLAIVLGQPSPPRWVGRSG